MVKRKNGRWFLAIKTHNSESPLRGKAMVLAVFIAAGIAVLLSAPLVSALMGGEGLMWSVSPDAPIRLEVCWENPQPADATAREWARLALKRSWERYARVIFVGWGQCQDEGNAISPPHTLGPRRPGVGDENIKIQIKSSGGGQNPAHGSWGDHQKSGVILNLYCGQACVEHLAIHEIGHALGFYHGEERADWPSTPQCPEQWSGHTTSWPWWPIPTERRWGNPDVDSTMAYCSGTSTELSPIDIAGVRRAYERRLPGTVLSPVASLCLSSHASEPNGDWAFGWECDEAFDDQEWVYDRVRSSLHIQEPGRAGDPRCLDVDTVTYSKVQIWDCHYGANQQWKFRRVLLRGYGGLCLTRRQRGPGPVTMETCTGADTQLWRLDAGDQYASLRFKAETANLCLAASGVSGSSVVAEICEGSFQVHLPLVLTHATEGSVRAETAAVVAPQRFAGGGQDFHLIKGGQIRLPSVGGGTQYCLDVHDVWNHQFISGQGGPRPGQRVQVFQCYDSQLNQRWNLTGDIISVNKCLTLSGDNTSNGAPAVVSRCDGSLDQDWDYYW
ncbi:MAG: ricin-type beta-trefoil lectin domain protein [Anaerolineae bacterium]|jgi:hypothetical protein